jgi:thiamine kinase-like enzyme
MENYHHLLNDYIKIRMGETENFTYQLERLNGLSNEIFLMKIKDKTSGIVKETCIFRKFGQISEMVDRNLEGRIIEKLSLKGLTPEIIATDMKKYRFEEYIDDGDVIDKYYARSEKFIEKLIEILVLYTTLSFIHNYKIDSDPSLPKIDIHVSNIYNDNSYGLKVAQNMFDLCISKLTKKANDNFQIFSEKFLKNYHVSDNWIYDGIPNEKILARFEKFSYYVRNFKEMFLKVFPTEGLLVLNHNDVHKLNLLASQGRDKIYILDHEYAALNLIGVDIVNFLIETNYDYNVKLFPFYEYKPELINFQNYHKIFLKFVDKFIKKQKDLNSNRVFDVFDKQFEEIKSFEYFLGLIRVISLFWMLYCAVYIDYNTLEHREKFDYFQHAMDRISLYETADAILNRINDKPE